MTMLWDWNNLAAGTKGRRSASRGRTRRKLSEVTEYVTRSKCGGYIYMETGALDHLRRPRDYDLGIPGYGRGWYSTPFYDETFSAGVSQLPARDGNEVFIGWVSHSDFDGITVLAETFDSAYDAWAAADSVAKRLAEEEFEYQTRWREAYDADDDRQQARESLREAHAAARDLIESIRIQQATSGPVTARLCDILADRLREYRQDMRRNLRDIRNATDTIAELGMADQF